VEKQSERDALAISALLRAGSAERESSSRAVAVSGGASALAPPPPPALSPPRTRVTSPTPAEVDAALGGLPALLAAHAHGAGGADLDASDEAHGTDEYGRPARSRPASACPLARPTFAWGSGCTKRRQAAAAARC
jgi:hypothetical protein